MRGIVFTEFLEMVEAQFGAVICERIIAAAQLPSRGAYTSVGTYAAAEMFALVGELSRVTGTTPADLVQSFGAHLFARFTVLFPHFFRGIDSAMGFLEIVDGVIHQEVRKLYPDAELPSFHTERLSNGDLQIFYVSERPLADLAEGLIRGCIHHFGVPMQLERGPSGTGDAAAVRFLVKCPRERT